MNEQRVEDRALQSGGHSNAEILATARRAVDNKNISGSRVVDVGCGRGDLRAYVCDRFREYVGVDVVRYEGFPEQGEFCQLDLDTGQLPVTPGSADLVTAVEVIEHVENPRDLMRKLVRVAKPGGWIIVTTPNQLSILSLATLSVKQRFNAFQDVHYPTHITALLPVDLQRMAAECGLEQISIEYSLSSRLPFSKYSYPRIVSRRFPRFLSDNVLMVARKPLRG